MAIEDGAWIMRGLDWDDPSRIQSWEELIGWIDEVGFLPLFKNEADGFSAEENTSDLYWWTGGRGTGSLGVAAADCPQRKSCLRQVLRRQGRFYLQGVVPPLRQLAAGRLRL